MKDVYDDKLIIERACKRDPEAFRHIYDKYWRYVLYICNKLCDNQEDAKEAAQDAFLQTFKHISKLDDHEKLKSWIGTIATRES